MATAIAISRRTFAMSTAAVTRFARPLISNRSPAYQIQPLPGLKFVESKFYLKKKLS
jgi:hypothetical protein